MSVPRCEHCPFSSTVRPLSANSGHRIHHVSLRYTIGISPSPLHLVPITSHIRNPSTARASDEANQAGPGYCSRARRAPLCLQSRPNLDLPCLWRSGWRSKSVGHRPRVCTTPSSSPSTAVVTRAPVSPRALKRVALCPDAGTWKTVHSRTTYPPRAMVADTPLTTPLRYSAMGLAHIAGGSFGCKSASSTTPSPASTALISHTESHIDGCADAAVVGL